MKKTKQDNDVTNHISLVYTKNDIKPSRPIESSAVYDKNKQDKDMTDRTSVVYTKNETGVVLPIRPRMVCHENHTRQRYGQFYRCGLRQKPY